MTLMIWKLIVSSTGGIGYEIVLNLASRGCRVIIADKEFHPDLEHKIFKETHSTNIVSKYVDLVSFKSIRALAKQIVDSGEDLHILINNAGIGYSSAISEDGLGLTMQVNYFGGFLLTHLLVGLLKKSSGRIIFTSSFLSFCSNASLDNLKYDKSDTFSYFHSKLYDIIAADMFSKKLKKFNVTSNSYHPWVVATNIFRSSRKRISKLNIPAVIIFICEIVSLIIGKTPEEGAQTAIFLACANEVNEITGKFFGHMSVMRKPHKARDKKFCEAVWRATEEMVRLGPHEKI